MNNALLNVRLARKQPEATDICSFELVAEDGRALPAFTAGAHIDVHLPGGLIRQYSLCNAPDETHRYLIAVLRDPASRGGSTGMHALVEGQSLQISAPRNHFPLATAARRHLLIAGGIGITPLLCMAEALQLQGADFGLHYCARSSTRMAFVERLSASPFAARVRLHPDDAGPAQALPLAELLDTTSHDTHLYVCGPTGFMDWVLNSAAQAGWPQERLHREYFAGAAVDTSADGRFEVQIASTGAVIPVAPQQSVVAALAACGIEIPVSCEQGVCGTCITRVLAGQPDHRDMYFTPEEQAANDQFTPCCSRSLSARLVLDL
ncbi:PDR/VanB family oxidoreductase [Ideonella sp.]|uniref:PDR/VanB family oxidoreductase n=1 Tax=Ideonella sp. TaxID=1929293 RepID=UPI003BB5B234